MVFRKYILQSSRRQFETSSILSLMAVSHTNKIRSNETPVTPVALIHISAMHGPQLKSIFLVDLNQPT